MIDLRVGLTVPERLLCRTREMGISTVVDESLLVSVGLLSSWTLDRLARVELLLWRDEVPTGSPIDDGCTWTVLDSNISFERGRRRRV